MKHKKNVSTGRPYSQVPYAVRLQMEKYATIKEHRDEAARIALQVGCVALNDTEKMGKLRLTRYARRVQELIAEYYEDPEVQSQHLAERLTEMGFLMQDGRMLVVEEATDETAE